MWSFFSRDPAKDFPYEIGEEIQGLENKSIWTLHKGKKKVNGDPVSVFIFEVKTGTEPLLDTAKAAVKRLKTLRHPNILTYVDSLETDKLVYLVTEQVLPLEYHLQNSVYNEDQRKLAISWGIHQVAKGLGFLVNDCKLAHNNMCMASIFVDRAGEWRIGGVEYMGSVSEDPIQKTLPALQKYDPPEKSNSPKSKITHSWSRDSWGLGCLLWEIFNGSLPNPSSLKSLGKIPKNLVPHYCELVGANPSSRPNPLDFIKKCRSSGGYLNNKFIDLMLFLEEIQIKDVNEKNRFFSNLTNVLDNFPPDVCQYKILPLLLNAYEFGNAGSSILAPMFKLSKLLDSEEYQKRIVPCVVKLFSSKDRATRARLLQQMDQFIDHLQPSVVNDQIFPQVTQGFLDTNPTIREETVKCMLHLAPKLNYHNLNEEMLRHFARIQSRDEQGGIRTNTTVCLGKLACYLHPQIRQKVLISAFARAMRDPFPPARIAGILALSATQNYYSLNDCATKVLPVLCMLTVDPEKSVRDHAFKAMKGYLGKLEKVSEDPSLKEQMEADINAASASSHSTFAASWAGWAVTAVASKFYRSSHQTTSPSESSAKEGPAKSSPETPVPTPAAVDKAKPSSGDAQNESEEEETWADQDWGSMEDTSTSKSQHESTTTVIKPELDGWDEDEDWESFEVSKTSQEDTRTVTVMPQKDLKKTTTVEDEFIIDTSAKPASMYNWGSQQSQSDLFFSAQRESSLKLSSSEHTPPKSTAKSTPQGWDTDDNWDSWNEKGDDKLASLKAKADIVKQKREERRQQRQKELQEKRAARQGGPLKLGAQRL